MRRRRKQCRSAGRRSGRRRIESERSKSDGGRRVDGKVKARRPRSVGRRQTAARRRRRRRRRGKVRRPSSSAVGEITCNGSISPSFTVRPSGTTSDLSAFTSLYSLSRCGDVRSADRSLLPICPPPVLPQSTTCLFPPCLVPVFLLPTRSHFPRVESSLSVDRSLSASHHSVSFIPGLKPAPLSLIFPV